MPKTFNCTVQQKHKSTNTTLDNSKSCHRNAQMRAMPSLHCVPCGGVTINAVVHCSFHPLCHCFSCVKSSIHQSKGGVIKLESFDSDEESVMNLECHIYVIQTLCSPHQLPRKNSSAENSLAIAPVTMKEKSTPL